MQKMLKTVIRDPVHGDIPVTQLEEEIVNSEVFQRLHRVKQLGLAYLVYPGTTHSRWAHSLGTLYAAQRMVDDISRSGPMEWYSVALTRLCALLHDLAHIPFGHTLEDEGTLFPPQWEDGVRVHFYLGDGSEIGRAILREMGRQCLDDIIGVFTATEDGKIQQLPFPFVADIVGDTVCADLLDYSQRDALFAGFDRADFWRITHCLFINRDGTHFPDRVVLDLCRSDGKVRLDALSEVLHLLQVRYLITERIHSHPIKIAASAMIIQAVHAALSEGVLSKNELLVLGDDELLFLLAEKGPPISRQIVRKLKQRQLYKPVFTCNVSGRKEFERWSDPQTRWQISQELEERSKLPPGSVIIYSPRWKKSKKASKLKVKLASGIVPLSEIPIPEFRTKFELIEESYVGLARLQILIDPAACESAAVAALTNECEKTFG